MHTVPTRLDIARAKRRHPSWPTSRFDQRLTPDAVLGGRDPKVAALLARPTEPAA